jgi:hypothetical protein
MSTNLIKAADDARRILKGFKAFAEVADALEAAGQAELRAAEAGKLLADLQPKIDAAKVEVVEAKVQAAGHVEAAKQHAADCVFVAKSEADGILRKAQAAAEALEITASDLLTKRKAEAVSAMAERDAALVKRDALAKECEALEARLAKAQASVAKLLG